MKPTAVAARVALLLFLGWLYGGDLLRWGQAQQAEVTALSELPRLWLGLLGTVVTLAGAAVLVMARGKPASWQPLRLLTVCALGLLFLDFVVLSSRGTPLSAEEQTQLAVHAVAEAANAAAGTEAVPRDPALLTSFVEGLGPVPFFVNAQRVPAWKVELRERCAGPAAEAGQASAGTLIYCIALDRKQAWVTAVGTQAGSVFGSRAIVSTSPDWVGEVRVAPEAQPENVPADQPVWGAPTPDEP